MLVEGDDGGTLEAPITTLPWPTHSSISSTWLATQVLEEIEVHLSWQQG